MINKKLQLNRLWEKEIFRQFVKFCFVGFANTIIDFSVYIFVSRVLGVYFLYANILAIIVAMTFSFFLNKYWTFKNLEKKIKTQYIKFTLVNLVYFFLNNSIVFILVANFKFYDLGAKAVAIIVGLFWNFIANRYWTFKN